MTDITDIDDYRPHINTQDPVTGIRHIIPVAMIDSIAAGRLPVQDDEVMRAICYMLVEELQKS